MDEAIYNRFDKEVITMHTIRFIAADRRAQDLNSRRAHGAAIEGSGTG